jgi:hypothetical protein
LFTGRTKCESRTTCQASCLAVRCRRLVRTDALLASSRCRLQSAICHLLPRMRPGIGRIRPQLAQDAGIRSSGRLRDPHLTLSMIRGSPTLLSKHSLPCCFPARSSRETPVQTIEMLSVLARLRLAPPCIFRKSPCIFPNLLHPQPIAEEGPRYLQKISYFGKKLIHSAIKDASITVSRAARARQSDHRGSC